MDVSVLLNFTSHLAFERTDPLMSLVAAREPLLFYDRLTVGEFDTNEETRLEQTKEIMANLRNLLEARAISTEGVHDERIRLIVILDFVDGLVEPGDERIFPVQKVRLVRDLIKEVFGPNNPLLDKMEYSFIFIGSDQDDKTLSSLFENSLSFLSSVSLDLNQSRDGLFQSGVLNSPDEEWSIDHPDVHSHYLSFYGKLTGVVNKIVDILGNSSLRDEFKNELNQRISVVRTVGDFSAFDYDGAVRACLQDVIGLRTREFGKDCVFFLLDFNGKEEEKIYIKSLIQLLVTISQTNYTIHFKPRGNSTNARFFVWRDRTLKDIRFDALNTLQRNISACRTALRDAHLREDEEVDGFVEYTENAQSPHETDTHNDLNQKLKEDRTKLIDEFVRIRRIPFFFGKRIDDWESWYFPVLESVQAIYVFEDENDRPLYDSPRRITQKEMSAKTPTTPVSYRSLEERKHKLEKEKKVVGEVESLNDYMRTRREKMASFYTLIGRLKEEMTKLGYFTCLFWIGVLSVIGFALCFAFHFFWFDNSDPLYLIAIAAGAAGLLFIVAALVGQKCIKNRIRRIYIDIDSILDLLQTNLMTFIKGVQKRAKDQRKADINRRNLDAIEEKLNFFNSHKQQVSLWENYFEVMEKTLGFILERVSDSSRPTVPHLDSAATVTDDVTISKDSFVFNSFPSMPYAVRSQFYEMNATLGTAAIVVDSITSFIQHFRFDEIR